MTQFSDTQQSVLRTVLDEWFGYWEELRQTLDPQPIVTSDDGDLTMVDRLGEHPNYKAEAREIEELLAAGQDLDDDKVFVLSLVMDDWLGTDQYSPIGPLWGLLGRDETSPTIAEARQIRDLLPT